MKKKEYVGPEIKILPIKIEPILMDWSTDDPLARESGDLDLEEFEEEEKTSK